MPEGQTWLETLGTEGMELVGGLEYFFEIPMCIYIYIIIYIFYYIL